MKTEALDQLWAEISTQVMNKVKVYLLKEHVEDMLYYYSTRLDHLVRRYARFLPAFVAESEMDDLKTISRLEFVETLKAWDSNKSDAIWPLAQARIIGAMKDHIRYITKSDPSRFYDWITDAAYVYMAANDRADFETTIETGMQLNQAMEVLTTREKQVVIAHTKSDYTFKQIGDGIGISESQTSRIYKQAIEKMRKVLDKAENREKLLR